MSTGRSAIVIGSSLVGLLALSLPDTAEAKTTCERSGCSIAITIHMVAVGGTQDTIDAWIADIENVWNGDTTAGEPASYGECDCQVSVDVQFDGWVNTCTGVSGYHCIEVTPEPARDSAGKTYPAYMRGVSQKGSSIAGWWSSGSMNQPVYIGPGEGQQGPPYIGGPAHDAAHEAGHMMGLPDGNDANLMGITWGPDARPSPAQIDAVVEANCEGDDADCPDECCCGDGEIQQDKQEECDPMAEPNGCGPAETCFDCVCLYTGECGDMIHAPDEEECDPTADPNGCMLDEVCTDECVCEQPEVAVMITEPSEGAILNVETAVIAEVTATLPVDRVEFFVDDMEQWIDMAAPFEWLYPPLMFIPGPHLLRVDAYDEAQNMASDTIMIISEP